MKNINKKNLKYKSLTELRKHPKFNYYSAKARRRNKLARKIYFTRKKLNFSQVELAEKADTEQRVISNIENGLYNPGYDLLSRIFEELDLKIGEEPGLIIPLSLLEINSNESMEKLSNIKNNDIKTGCNIEYNNKLEK